VKYLLLIYGEERDHEAMEADGSFVPACQAWTDELRRRGVLVTSGGLRPPADATTVRVRDDQVLLSDGPFAETKELIGGFHLIECADLDEALEAAAGHPAARYGTIEVRPLVPA
jgi:hypothetical protein